jgi:hypothetical protein
MSHIENRTELIEAIKAYTNSWKLFFKGG